MQVCVSAINELKGMFQQQARAERYEISQALLDCKMAEGSSVTDLILKSLPPSYVGFVMNFNMHGMNKTLDELFAMTLLGKQL